MSAAATPASASAPCATSTIKDSTSRPSCLPNLVCAHPTMHPVIPASIASAADDSNTPARALSYMVSGSRSETAMADTRTLYDEDFVAWTEQQAEALRAAAR